MAPTYKLRSSRSAGEPPVRSRGGAHGRLTKAAIFAVVEKKRVGSANGGRKTKTIGSNDRLPSGSGRVLRSAGSGA